MSQKPAEVLVVGAGPSGLILALSLARNGVPVRVIEASTAQREGQRGAGISPRTFEVFESLGIIDEVLKRAIRVPNICVFKMPEGLDIVNEFSMETYVDPTPAVPYPNLLLLGQDLLDRIIWAELAKHDCCTIDLGAELRFLEQFEDRVDVTIVRQKLDLNFETNIANGAASNAEPERSSYKWVIGADGARGVVRKLLGVPFIGQTVEQSMVVGDFIGDAPFFVNKFGWWRDTQNALTAIRPTETPGKFSFIIGRPDGSNHDEPCPNEDTIKELIRTGTGGLRTDIDIKNILWKSSYRLNVRMVESFRKGRVFLVGDAGHVHSPAGAQGMNTGVQDSYNLGWKLALVVKSLARPELLDTYNDERVPLVAEMLNLTNQIRERMMQSVQGHEDQALRRSGTLSQLGVNYRGCRGVIDEVDDDQTGDIKTKNEAQASRYGSDGVSVVKAGDRAPDAPGLVEIVQNRPKYGTAPTRLFHLFNPSKHTVLIFSELVPEEKLHPILSRLSEIQTLTKDAVRVIVVAKAGTKSLNNLMPDAGGKLDVSVYEDQNGYAYDAYKDPNFPAAIFVVRPDSMIGARDGTNAARVLEKYFGDIFYGIDRLSV